MMHSIAWWAFLGYAGNAIFGSRFFVQWFVSERAGKSVMPKSFWWISITGATLELVYAYFVVTRLGWGNGLPVILGVAPPLPIYIRNLMLIARHERTAATAPAEATTVEVSIHG